MFELIISQSSLIRKYCNKASLIIPVFRLIILIIDW